MASRGWRNAVKAEEDCMNLERMIKRYYGVVKKQYQEVRVRVEELGCCRTGHNGAGVPVY